MNLSQEINDFIENYEYPNFRPITFGAVLRCLVNEFDIQDTEDNAISAFKDMKNEYIDRNYVQETTSASSLSFHLQMTAQNLEDVDRVISDRFEIFEKTVTRDNCFENRLTIKYYRNPEYNEKRHYIEVVLLIEPDNKIKKILNVEKGGL